MKRWWFKLGAVLFIFTYAQAFCLSWLFSLFQFHQEQTLQLQQSLPKPSLFSLEPLPLFLSHLAWTSGLALLFFITIFFCVFIYLKNITKANSILLKHFGRPLKAADKKSALSVFAHHSNPYLAQWREGFISVLKSSAVVNSSKAKEKDEWDALPKEPLFSEVLSRLCRQSAHFYPFLSIHAQVEKDMALPVFSSSLFRALWELIKNTAEVFSRESKGQEGSLGPAELWIYTFQQDNWFCCEFEDRGPGMNDEEIAQAGRLYFSTKKSSAGLGLSLVQSVLSKMGGIVKLSSAEGNSREANAPGEPTKNKGLKVSLFIPMDYIEHIHNLKNREASTVSEELLFDNP